VLSLDPATLEDVLSDPLALSEAAGDPAAGPRLSADLTARIDAVRAAVADAPRRRVAALEWLDPPYCGGHWIPEMIAAAGGIDSFGTAPGARSRDVGWDEVAAGRPDVVVVMPCGLYAAEAEAEARRHRRRLASLGAELHAVDAASSFSRPGPRLADGVELLGHLLHPDRVPAPGALEWRTLSRRGT
jgi:iron complex transport system substrate-binding protein